MNTIAEFDQSSDGVIVQLFASGAGPELRRRFLSAGSFALFGLRHRKFFCREFCVQRTGTRSVCSRLAIVLCDISSGYAGYAARLLDTGYGLALSALHRA